MASTASIVSVCVGAAVLAGVYVLWGPDLFFKRRAHCPGLVNLGNTCFLNAVLQALAAVTCVRVWVGRESSGRLTLALHRMLTALNERREVTESPAEVLRALVWHRWNLDDFQQQDTHEVYHVLLTTLDEEMSQGPTLTGINLLVKGGLTESHKDGVLTKAGTVHAPLKRVSCPLRGLLTSELVCCHCQYTCPVKYESFDSISLTLPTYPLMCSLQSCLVDFVKSEVVYSVECQKCSKVKGDCAKRTFLKQLGLGRSPECLCIHLKRNVWSPGGGGLSKNYIHVSFPFHLDVGNITTVGRKNSCVEVVYELVAVIEHSGGPYSGHYVTYRRLTSEGRRSQWACTSDTSVHLSTLREVLNANAYMLFYQRTNKR